MAGYDKDQAKIEALRNESKERDVRGAADIKEFISLLRQPHATMLLVPALPSVRSLTNCSRTSNRATSSWMPATPKAAESGAPVPGLMVSLGYLDAYRSAWLPANLIQAQRDYFGAHTYERIDAKGTFHTEWERNENHESE